MPSHPVDVHVGKRLRARRTILGMSQESLGDSVGVTFQQIQKYEKGFNRIGSSRLYEFSRILNVPVAYFFEEFNDPTTATSSEAVSDGTETFEYDNLGNKEVLTLVRAYNDIEDTVVRKRILSLIKALSTNTSVTEDEDDSAEENRRPQGAAYARPDELVSA